MWFSESVQCSLAIAGVRFNFLPSWWYRNYGIEYGARMVFDPDYRLDTYLAMRRIMYQRFGQIQLGSPDPQPVVIAPSWGNAISPAAAGCRVEYPTDNYPVSYHLAPEEEARLHAPQDPAAVFPFNEITRQVSYLNGKLDRDVAPLIGLRGVLNDACLIGGVDVLGDLLDMPEATSTLLVYTCELALGLARHDHGLKPGAGFMIFNCAEIMVSPRTYERVLLPYDRRIFSLADSLGERLSIHHCGKLDAYLPIYRHLGSIGTLDIGTDSTIPLVLEAFPEAHLSYILDPRFLAHATLSEVADMMQGVLEAARGHWHRFSLNVADLDYCTPDDNITAIYEHCRRALG